MRNFILSFSLSLSIALIWLVSGCAVNPVTGKKQVVLMSEEQEIAMGKEYHPQVLAYFGAYQDEALQAFITEKGMEMAKVSHRPNLEYTFSIVDSPVINAFAVPGGYVYFTRGIMAHFSSEAEFAGVLGHEIGHITARHSVIQQRNQLLGQLGLIAGIILKPELAQFADPLAQGMGLLFLKFGRDAERQWDELGVEYATRIGYDAAPMSNFFDVLERKNEQSGSEVPTFLSTHPSPTERAATIRRLSEDWKKKMGDKEYAINRNSYLRKIEGLVYGEDPRQGFEENGFFYHPEMAFQFAVPSGWKLENSPSQVQMSPEEGNAVIIFRFAEGASLEAAASETLKQYNLESLEASNTTVNGKAARFTRAIQKQENGAELSVLMMHIQHKEQMFVFLGASDSNDYSTQVSRFRTSMESFANLTDSNKLNRQPERIRIVEANRSGTLSELLMARGVPQERLNELSLLNGMQLSDKVESGTLLKILR
jgi:predicted Zn-dependent protease